MRLFRKFNSLPYNIDGKKDIDRRTIFLLNNGMEIPALGFGVFMIQDQKVCAESVCAAIQEG
jgi:hypothetical protein